MELKDKLVDYVNVTLLRGRVTITADDDLLADNLVDSMGMMWLIGYIEEQLAMKIPPEDITIANFRSIGAIHDYLNTKVG